MKRIFALGLIGALLGSIGCTTTGAKEKSYTADQAPPLEKTAVKERVSMTPAMPDLIKRVSASEIDEGNAEEQARRLQNEMSREKSSAMKSPR
ncbi:MAG: hypothetical protein EXS09_02625 [Gemmataceae bacterium]|nr:hypothetical protein [Gemmataceae bacterium]